MVNSYLLAGIVEGGQTVVKARIGVDQLCRTLREISRPIGSSSEAKEVLGRWIQMGRKDYRGL